MASKLAVKLKKYTPALSYLASGLALFVLGTEPAWAIDVGGVMRNLTSNAQPVADGISMGSYIVGAASVFQSFMKFKEHQENPQQVKLKSPLTYLAVGGGLIALPSSITVGADSMYGNGAGSQTQGLNQGVLR